MYRDIQKSFSKLSLPDDVIKTLTVLKKNKFKLGIITDGRVEGSTTNYRLWDYMSLYQKLL